MKNRKDLLIWRALTFAILGIIFWGINYVGAQISHADDNSTPFTLTTNFNADRVYPASRALHFTFDMNKTKSGDLKPGDKIKFTVGSATDGSNSVAGLDVSTTRIDMVSSNNLFEVQTDPNSNPATITITPKANANTEDLANAQISIYVNTSDKMQADNIKRDYPLQVDFISSDGSTHNYLKDNIQITKTSSNDNNPDNPTSQFGNEIFGGTGGLKFASGFDPIGEDIWNGNYYSITDATSWAGDGVNDALIYSYNQPNMIAWAQIKLPNENGSVPDTIKWTISIPKRTSASDGKLAPFFPAYTDDNNGTLHVYRNIDGTFVAQNEWKYLPSESSETKLVFEATGLTDGNKDQVLNIPFDIRTSDVTDMVNVTSNVTYGDNKTNSRTVQMLYNSTTGAGFVPYFEVQDQTMTLSEARKLLYNSDRSLKSANEIITNKDHPFLVSLGDHNNPETLDDDKIYFDEQFDTGSLSYDKIQADHSYPMWVYAANSNGRRPGYRIANLIIKPDSGPVSEINGQFIDVDSNQVIGNSQFPINRPDNTTDGETTPVSQSFLNSQNISVPNGYHYATGSELDGKQQPSIVWGTTQSPVKIYVKKNTTPAPMPNPKPDPTPMPTPTPTPTPTPIPGGGGSSNVASKGTVVYSLKKIYLYKNTTFSTHERKAGYVSKPRVYRPMFVVTGYGHSANGRLRYQVRDVNHLTKNRGKTGYITAQWAYVRPVYYQTMHPTVTVINPRGVNAYMYKNLTAKTRNYKQGTVLHVTQIVKHNLTTRFVLTNGQYITANRKLVTMDKQTQPRYIKVKKAIYRYQNVNLSKRNKHAHFKKGTKIKIKNYDYSHANSVTNHGALRYHIAGGYITGNSKYVKILR